MAATIHFTIGDIVLLADGSFHDRNNYRAFKHGNPENPTVIPEGTAAWFDFCMKHDLYYEVDPSKPDEELVPELPVSSARQLKYHYQVEERCTLSPEETKVIAQFHARRDVDAFVEACRQRPSAMTHQYRIVCLSKRDHGKNVGIVWA